MSKLTSSESFFLGSVAYPAIELLWRGRTHPTMAIAGGLSMIGLNRLAARKAPAPLRFVTGAALITGIELGCGLLFNRKHKIWDYRYMPLNWRGQVCLPYSLIWGGISLAMTKLLE